MLPEHPDTKVKFSLYGSVKIRYWGEWVGNHPHGRGIMWNEAVQVVEIGWWMNG